MGGGEWFCAEVLQGGVVVAWIQSSAVALASARIRVEVEAGGSAAADRIRVEVEVVCCAKVLGGGVVVARAAARTTLTFPLSSSSLVIKSRHNRDLP